MVTPTLTPSTHADGAAYQLLIIHGMAEHSGRYAHVIPLFAELGAIVCTLDVRGHGHYRSAQVAEQPDAHGHFGDGVDAALLMSDIDTCLAAFDDSLPIYVLGHSMGSMLALHHAHTAGAARVAGYLFSGMPAAPLWLHRLGRAVAWAEDAIRPNAASVLDLNFVGYNREFAPNRTAFDWLSVNHTNVDAYMQDPLCGFRCSPLFYQVMLGLFITALRAALAGNIDAGLRFYSAWGAHDPVTLMGQGGQALARRLGAAGLNLTAQEWPNCRHEILQETVAPDVVRAMHEWMSTPAIQTPPQSERTP